MRHRCPNRDFNLVTIACTAFGLGALPLLTACGDDLESRQAAVQEMRPTGGQATAEQAPPQARSDNKVAQSSTPAEPEDNAQTDDGMVIDAAPEALIDEAQGFSTDPIDDTAGFDPTPSDSGGFAPEPMAPESFED